MHKFWMFYVNIKNVDICCGKFFVDCKSEVSPHKHVYLAFIFTEMTTKESPEQGVWNIACRQMMNTPTICVQNTAYISTIIKLKMVQTFNPLMPKDPYSGRTAPLTSKCCILYIYSTNTGTEYFKHGIYCLFFSLQNAVCFIILSYLVPVLFTFYVQVC